jgi:type VI secretion system FHA domain protein
VVYPGIIVGYNCRASVLRALTLVISMFAARRIRQGRFIVVLIRAVSFKGGPVGREVAARFGEGGGTIGRGESSTLVLPDPERYISRTHASISFQAGGFVITDNSSKNPIILNGQPLGPGSQVRLRDRDEIKLGGYILEVTLVSSGDPSPSPGEAGRPHTQRPAQDDPFAAWPLPVDPFVAPSKGASPSVPRHEAVAPPPSKHTPRDALADLHGKEPSIDDVLDLKPSGSWDRLEQDPRPGRPYLPPDADILDPLEFLRSSPGPPLPPTMQDHAQEIFTPFAPPAARPDPALEMRADMIPPMTPQSEPPVREVPPAQPARGSVPDALGHVL